MRLRGLFPCAVAMAAALDAGAAAGNDWQVSSFFTQTFGVDTNLSLNSDDNDDEGLDGTSQTSLGATIRLDRPRSTWILSPGIAYTAATDRDDNLSSDNVNPRLSGLVTYVRPRYTLEGNVSVIPDLVSFTQLDDTGRTDSDAIQVTASAGGSIRYDVDALNALSLGVNGRLRTFSENDDELVDNRALSASLGWSRVLSPLTEGRLSMSVSHFTADDELNREALSLELRGRGSTDLRDDLSLSFSLGAALSRRTEDEAQPGGGLRRVRDETFTVSPVGDIGVNYALTPDTRASFRVSQFVDQNSDGDVVNRARVAANIQTDLDAQNSIDIGLDLSFQNPLFDDDNDTPSNQTFSFTPSYRYDLNEDWSLRLGYRLRGREEDGDLEISNGVFLTVSRGFFVVN